MKNIVYLYVQIFVEEVVKITITWNCFSLY